MNSAPELSELSLLDYLMEAGTPGLVAFWTTVFTYIGRLVWFETAISNNGMLFLHFARFNTNGDRVLWCLPFAIRVQN
jgi:hypothetical protein